jgi:Gpi18-like mannosyltransferase
MHPYQIHTTNGQTVAYDSNVSHDHPHFWQNMINFLAKLAITANQIHAIICRRSGRRVK